MPKPQLKCVARVEELSMVLVFTADYGTQVNEAVTRIPIPQITSADTVGRAITRSLEQL